MKSCFSLLLSFFVFALYPLAANSREEKQTTPMEQFQEILNLAQTESTSTFLKEHRREMFETAEKALDDPNLDSSMRGRIFYSVFMQLGRFYGRTEPEIQESLTKESNAFFRKYQKNEQDREICESALEAVCILPIRAKLQKVLTNLTEPIPFEEQREALLELHKTIEPLKLKQGGFSHEYVSAFVLNGMGTINRQLQDPTQRKQLIPVLEAYSKLFASKENEGLNNNSLILGQMLRRAKSDGQTAPWDDTSFTALDGQKMKIADFRGKPLLVAFQPIDGPWIELIKDCVEHWKSKDLHVLFITSNFPDATMKKFAEVCEIPFPVWNLGVSGFPKELKETLPPHLSSAFSRSAMLIDADGKVVNSYIGYKNLAAEIGQFFGVPANDESLKNVQQKSWDFFFKELRSKKLLDIPEDATAEQMHRRFLAALTDLLSSPQNMFDQQMVDPTAELPELVDRVVAKTDDRKMIESMYNGMLFLAQNQPLVPARISSFAANIADKAKQHNLPKIAAEARLIDFKCKFRDVTNVRSFIEFRKGVFDFVRKSKDDCLSPSVASLFQAIGYGISRTDGFGNTRRYPEDMVVETYLEMVNILEEMNDSSIQSAIETFRGIANRLQLLGKEMPIEGETIDGKPFDPALYKGKVVLVDFWATWCGPCIAEVPNMKKAYEKYHEKGFEIVAISTDQDLDALKEYLETKPLPWVCLADELAVQSGKPAMKQRYGVTGIPTMILVGRDGRVILLEARGETLTNKLEELFAE